MTKNRNPQRINSASVPQANTIGRVVEVVEAVAIGVSTPSELASRLGVSTRQGLYYRTAAENLKLVRCIGDDFAPTGLGKRLLASGADPYRQQRVLREACLKNPALKAVHAQLSSPRGKSIEGLAKWLASVSDLNAQTAARRLSSVVNWLLYAGLAYPAAGRLKAIPA